VHRQTTLIRKSDHNAHPPGTIPFRQHTRERCRRACAQPSRC
jgi:hypothetical protein